MNFELLSLSWAKAATLKTDALLVLVADGQKQEPGLALEHAGPSPKTGRLQLGSGSMHALVETARLSGTSFGAGRYWQRSRPRCPTSRGYGYRLP
jgi:hypothetical protein